MINPKELKLGDEVWVGGIIFGKSHARCSLNMRPTRGFVTKIEPNPYYKGCSSIYITDGAANTKAKTIYVIDSYYYNKEEDLFVFRTREEAVEEYNRQVNEELDFLQSLMDKHKKKLILK